MISSGYGRGRVRQGPRTGEKRRSALGCRSPSLSAYESVALSLTLVAHKRRHNDVESLVVGERCLLDIVINFRDT